MPSYQSYDVPTGVSATGAQTSGAPLVVTNNSNPPTNLPAVSGGKFVGVASATPRNDNFIDQLIGPNYIDYPLWVPDRYSAQPQPQPQPTTTPPATTPPTTTPSGPTAVSVGVQQQQPVAMIQMPGMPAPVPVMLMATMATIPQQQQQTPPAGNGGATSTTPPASLMPVAGAPVRTFSPNPAFAPAKAKVRKVKHPPKHGGSSGPAIDAVEIDAAPIKLTVPQGCNALEVMLGEIEPMPGGTASDIAELLDAGKQRITDIAGGELDETQLNPGDVVNLVIPWRAHATATIAAGTARRSVRIEFYNAIQTYQQHQ